MCWFRCITSESCYDIQPSGEPLYHFETADDFSKTQWRFRISEWLKGDTDLHPPVLIILKYWQLSHSWKPPHSTSVAQVIEFLGLHLLSFVCVQHTIFLLKHHQPTRAHTGTLFIFSFIFSFLSFILSSWYLIPPLPLMYTICYFFCLSLSYYGFKCAGVLVSW